MASRSRRGWLAAAAAAALAVGACSLFPPGEDPEGRALKAEATEVLRALNDFTTDSGRTPASLNELVPRYLARLPASAIRYSRERPPGELRFSYVPSSPSVGRTDCSAMVGTRTWFCSGSL